MGSMAKAVVPGFVCRLCSKINHYVIMIYGEEGRRLRLEEKINAYLPISISRNDPLPKTVCPSCVASLERHSEMVKKFFRLITEQSVQAKKDNDSDEDS